MSNNTDQPVLAALHAASLARPASGGAPGSRPRRALAALVALVAALHAVVIWYACRGHAERLVVPPGQVMDVSLLSTGALSDQIQPQDAGAQQAVPVAQEAVRRPGPVVTDTEPREPRLKEPVRADTDRAVSKADALLPPSVSPAREMQAAAALPSTANAPPVVSNQATSRSVGVAEAPPAAPAAASPRRLPSSAVSFAVPPVKVYPEASRSLDESGVVQVSVLVDERGHAAEVRVERSSGYSRLDRAAVNAVRAARFNPHVEAGTAQPFWVTIPFNFDLED